jgi:nucleoside-diphosphate-sugar epimerase
MTPSLPGRCVVTGATGFVGGHLCRELLEAGYEVVALHRVGSDLSGLDGLDVTLAEGDVLDRQSLLGAFRSSATVFHIAALFREARHGDDRYWAVNVEGTRNVLDAAIDAGVGKVVHCSTVGVHSHIPHPPADETEDYRPADTYQRTKCEGEKLALEYFRGGAISGCVIRPAMIWGPGDTRTRKLFQGIQRRRMPIIGTGDTLLHWVDVRDLSRAFRLAAERADNDGEVYIVAGEAPVRLEDLFTLIAERLGVSVLPLKIPARPVQLLGDVVEFACRPFGIEPPIYRRRVDFFTKTRAFDASKARERLEYRPAQTIRGEVDDIIRSYRELGWLS